MVKKKRTIEKETPLERGITTFFSSPEERNNAIAKKAYDIYLKRNGKSRGKKWANYKISPTVTSSAQVQINDEEVDWLEAEQEVDSLLFSQPLEPKELYKSLMLRFYSGVNTHYLSGEELAKAYLDHLYENRTDFEKVRLAQKPNNAFDFRNVSLLMDQTSIPFLTKRILMLADTSLISHGTTKFSSYRYENLYLGSYEDDMFADDHYLTNCPDLGELGNWLKDAKPLIDSGEIFYFPQITLENHSSSSEYFKIGYQNHIFDAVIKCQKLVQPLRASPVRTKVIQSIVQVDIPYIDGVNLSDFSKITVDEHQHLEKFRDHLKENLIDLSLIDGSEAFDANLTKIGLKIKSGTNALTKDIKSLRRKNAIQVAGTTIGTIVATLVAIQSNLLDYLPEIVGAGGGLLALLKQISDNKSQFEKLEDSPYYYLWLLDTK